MATPDPADAEDIASTLRGDREAFGRLFDRHARLVRAVVFAVSRDFDSVEDLTQESFLRAYRRLGTLKNHASFRSWLQGIARLVARERLRQLSRSRHEQLDPNLEQVNGELSTDKTAELNDELRFVMKLVDELPTRERLAVHAFFFHDKNADEAADRLEISRSSFYALLSAALTRMRNKTAKSTSQARSTL